MNMNNTMRIISVDAVELADKLLLLADSQLRNLNINLASQTEVDEIRKLIIQSRQVLSQTDNN